MINVIGVKFRTAGKIYYFDPAGMDIKYRDHVIVETARGVEYGTVVFAPQEVADDMVVQPLKPVLRVATPQDDATHQNNRDKEEEAYKICLEKIREHGLEMKLIDTEYTFDNNKVLFYFTADGRIDFRALVKDLAAIFRTRIELRQIGVRDETKLIGGMSVCGRPLCCSTYLTDFAPVSIKMAKEQNLSLNPAKISGVCGRLMCCLKNEEEAYEHLNANLPAIGATVSTSDNLQGEVQSVSVLKQLVKVIVTTDNDVKEVREYPVAELTFRHQKTYSEHKNSAEIDEKELQELELLEKEEPSDGLELEQEEPTKRRQHNKNPNRDSGRRGNNNHGTKGSHRSFKKQPHENKSDGEHPQQPDEQSSSGKHGSRGNSARGRYNNHHNSRGNRNNGYTGRK